MQQNNKSVMSFQERSKLGMENLSKQLPVTLNQAKKQIEFLKANSNSKKQEATRLIDFAKRNNLWIENFNAEKYISEGAEQKVYLMNSHHVFKLNDSIYFTSWFDYFNNLLLHNFFFEDTSYELLGFTSVNHTLYSLVKQNYIKITEATNLSSVKKRRRPSQRSCPR